MRTKELFKWMKERYSIYTKRQAGLPKPWTKDPILQRYRFCNVYRELDTVTQWIAAHWRKPHAKDQHLWFAMVVARLFNLPESLAAIGYPVPWQPAAAAKVLHKRETMGLNNFNGAYIVSTNGRAMNKVDYVLQLVLAPMWDARSKMSSIGCNLVDYHSMLTNFQGMGSFMAAQVVCDLSYVAPLNSAEDWDTWAASGPGSRRGLNRVMGYEVNNPWNEATWLLNLQTLKASIDPLVSKSGMPFVHARDLQNCLCEFDKSERARLGEGRPKSRYPGV